MPDWVIQAAVMTAVGVVGWFLRGLRQDVDAIKLDLVKNYVTHEHLAELKRDQRRMLAMLTNMQIQMARKFGFKPIDGEGNDGEEV